MASAKSSLPNAMIQNAQNYVVYQLSNEVQDYIFQFGIVYAGQDLTFNIMENFTSIIMNKTITVAPGPPILTVGSGMDHHQVKIKMAPFNNSDLGYVDYYRYWYYRDGDETIIRENDTLTTSDPTTYTTVKPGDLYYYNAFAVRKGIQSITAVRGYRTPPSAITELTVSDVTNSSFLLKWTLPDTEDTAYENIEIYAAEIKIVTLSKNTNEFWVRDYTPSQMAVLHVFTVTDEPYKAKSAPKIISARTKPARVDPEMIVINQIDDKPELLLTWKKPGGYFNGYTVTIEYDDGSKKRESTQQIAYDKLKYVMKRPQHEYLRPGVAYKGRVRQSNSIFGFSM